MKNMEQYIKLRYGMSNSELINDLQGNASFLNARMPVVVLLDLSGSMEENGKIASLRKATRELILAFKEDPLAKKKIDLCIIGFNNEAWKILEFTPVDSVSPSIADELEANGGTAMGAALSLAATELVEYKRDLKAQGVPVHHRMLSLVVTDGYPTDDVSAALERIKTLKENGLSAWAVAVQGEGVDVGFLNSAFPNHTCVATIPALKDFFRWFSNTGKLLSSSCPGSKVALPTLPNGTGLVQALATE